MKILLTALNSKYAHSNLALKYLKVCLKKDCPSYETVTNEYTINDNMLSILASIYAAKADIYGFSCYIWNIEQTLQICENLKKIKPEAVIILGGPEVSYDSKEVIKKNTFIDFIISGEGELALSKLINALSNNSDNYSAIEGLAYRNQNGNITLNEGFCIIDDLSIIPSPFEGDLSCYKQKVTYFESSRGCPYNCSYCLSSTIKGVRYFPIERVKKELLKLIEAEVKQVKFVDRTFNCSKERAMEIWKYIVANNTNTIFHFEIAAHLIDDEMLGFLEQIPQGMFDFEIGVQTTNEEAISAIGRKTDFDKIKTTVNAIRSKNNIHLHLDLIAGLPYEDYKSFEKSFNDVYTLKPHMLQLGFLKLLKGSRIRDEYKENGYKFTSKPPYEVLESKHISYEEIVLLKQIEEILEIYKNSGRYENSVNYLNKIYSSPFKLFEELSNYWYKRNSQARRISQEENYDILFEFFENNINKNLEEFREVLKLDFVLNNFGAQKRSWLKKYVFKDMKVIIRNILSDQEFINQYCSKLLDCSLTDKIKRVHFEIFKIDIINTTIKQPILILIQRKIDSRGIIKTGFKVVDRKYYKYQILEEIE